MSTVLKILTAVQWIAVLALVVIAIGVSMALDAERLAHQTTKTVHAEQLAQAHAERAIEEATRRKAEQELRDAQETHAAEVKTLHVNRDRDRAAGAAVAVRVRDAARATAALAGQVCADSSTTQLREAAGAAARMLADLRERADERAGILAQFATDAHLAGRACERDYDRTREALKAN
jgi:hypothetical protein